MAARATIIRIRDEALASILKSSKSLAGALNIDGVQPATFEGRDPAFQQARELERVAEFLGRVDRATGRTAQRLPMLEERVKTLTKERDDARAQIASARTTLATTLKEKAELEAQLKAATKPETKPETKP